MWPAAGGISTEPTALNICLQHDTHTHFCLRVGRAPKTGSLARPPRDGPNCKQAADAIPFGRSSWSKQTCLWHWMCRAFTLCGTLPALQAVARRGRPEKPPTSSHPCILPSKSKRGRRGRGLSRAVLMCLLCASTVACNLFWQILRNVFDGTAGSPVKPS